MDHGHSHDFDIMDADFEKEVLKSKGLVLVDFWAVWCFPCQMLEPILHEIYHEMGDKFEMKKMNVDDNPETTKKYQIMSIPTVMLFKDGEIVETFIGVQPKGAYENAITKHSA